MMDKEFKEAQHRIEYFIFIRSMEIKKALKLPYTYEDELLDEIDYGYKVQCKWLVDLNYEHLYKYRKYIRGHDREVEILAKKRMLLDMKNPIRAV